MSLLVEPETTREEIAEAITHVNALAKRCPSHFAAEWSKLHAQLDALLDGYLAAP